MSDERAHDTASESKTSDGNLAAPDIADNEGGENAVSYTHLDVYKRQRPRATGMRLPRPTAHARCIRVPPVHRTARAVEPIERNPSMLKKTLVFALSAALCAFSLAGCAGNSSDSTKASDADSQEKTEQAADAPEGASAAPRCV